MIKVPSVSLVTITQHSRSSSLSLLCKMINDQTYTNIIQWVIVEGSKNKNDGSLNKLFVNNLSCKVPIQYIDWSGKKLGGLRQLSNNHSKGDIIVCMDDDDFYPPTRVEIAVNELSNSKCLIAGCSSILIYDFILQKFMLYSQYIPNFTTNNAMAYKKEYLLNHKYDENDETMEESSFTNGFKENLVQLNTFKSIILISHKNNTYNKRELFVYSTLNLNQQGRLIYINDNILNHINNDIFQDMKSIYEDTYNPEYDIVYMCGGFSSIWDPTSENLGGSEQAVKHLSQEWVKHNKKVAVYGNFKQNINHNGVHYYKWTEFNYSIQYNIIIMWRLYGYITIMPFNVNCKKLYLDLHDNMTINPQYDTFSKQYGFSKIDKIFFKSQYHKDEYIKKYGEHSSEIIMNGVRIPTLSEPVVRDKYRFVYCSSYTRGLIHILTNIWPKLYKLEPKAELHVYYGFDGLEPKFIEQLKNLLSQPGVMEHGRQNIDIIYREKYRSNFHLYLSKSPEEIDCISIRESIIAGAIPILYKFGVFNEREGFFIDEKSDTISQILNLLHNDTLCSELRTKISNCKNLEWNEVSEQWLKFI